MVYVNYKRGRRKIRYCTDELTVDGYGARPAPPPTGPFESCGDCPYASVGFKCWSEEGVCLRNHYGRKNELEGCVEQ